MIGTTQRTLLLLSSFILASTLLLLEPDGAIPCAAETAAPAAVMTQTAPAAVETQTTPAVTGTAAVAGAPEGSAKETPLPNQYGVSAEYGYTYDPQADLSFLLARVFAIYDYGTVWHSDRPKSLRFKVEGAAGSTLTPSADLIVSVNMLALYYPAKISSKSLLRPYLEAGIGAIYTQFRVKGQGLHFNFNPLLGIGCELPQKDGKNPFMALRLHHLSNAELNHENRGVNSVVLQVGRYF